MTIPSTLQSSQDEQEHNVDHETPRTNETNPHDHIALVDRCNAQELTTKRQAPDTAHHMTHEHVLTTRQTPIEIVTPQALPALRADPERSMTVYTGQVVQVTNLSSTVKHTFYTIRGVTAELRDHVGLWATTQTPGATRIIVLIIPHHNFKPSWKEKLLRYIATKTDLLPASSLPTVTIAPPADPQHRGQHESHV